MSCFSQAIGPAASALRPNGHSVAFGQLHRPPNPRHIAGLDESIARHAPHVDSRRAGIERPFDLVFELLFGLTQAWMNAGDELHVTAALIVVFDGPLGTRFESVLTPFDSATVKVSSIFCSVMYARNRRLTYFRSRECM